MRFRSSSLRRAVVSALLLFLLIAIAPPARARLVRMASLPTLATTTPPTAADVTAPDTGWARRIEKLIGARAMSVAVGTDGAWLYRHDANVRRTPASNEKLLLSMALMDALGPDHRMPVTATAGALPNGDGVVIGPLWINGSGDPDVGMARIKNLARDLKDAGISKIRGRVLGAVPPFAHDWKAPGWKPSFPATEVALPTALTFEGNTAGGRHIDDPERRAATALTQRLRAIGVGVTGRPGDGNPPDGLIELASVSSRPLEDVLREMNVPSSNFHAETLGKLLGLTNAGAPGTIAKAGQAIEDFASTAAGVNLVANDGSGLSYQDDVAPAGMVALLWYSEDEAWGEELRMALPTGGQGTLSGRLAGIPVRAKTGTLDGISALSGWVRLDNSDEWAAFSIISRGMDKSTASRIEDAIVRTLRSRA